MTLYINLWRALLGRAALMLYITHNEALYLYIYSAFHSLMRFIHLDKLYA